MNSRMPGTANSLRRSRSITSWVGTPSRCSGGFRLMNIRPRLAGRPDRRRRPAMEPMPSTAGSAITISATLCCSFSIAWNEMSGEARVDRR